ncbi:MAG: hypothetical protein QNJ75_00365 [Acidimicrobiia bacterium]|nr:hypothetical protein [Acidimicrobiia bacterium]
MGEELTRSLRVLAERGEERGASAVLEDARAEAARPEAVGQPSWRRGLAVALGTAAVMLVLVAVTILTLQPFGTEELPPATIQPPIVPTTAAPIFSPDSPAPLNDINDLALAPNGDLWAATAAGVVRWDVATGEPQIFTESEGIPGRSVAAIDIAPDGTVWIVGDQGIGRYDGSWTTYSGADTPVLAGQLGALVVDHGGVVWAEAASAPLARFDGEWTSVAAPLGGEQAIGPSGLAIDGEGTLWVGMFEDGVYSFDGLTWRHFTAADGAPHRAGHIAVAPDGAVWAWDEGYYLGPELEDFVPGTGFARYDGVAWTTYTVDDGLLSNEGYVAISGEGSVVVVHREWTPDHEEIVLGVSRFDGDGWTTDIDGGPYGPIGTTVVAADGSIWMPSESGIYGVSGADAVKFVVPAELATPPAAPWTVVPDPEQAPIRVSTAIGDFEFSTVKPSLPMDLWHVAGTAYGAVAQTGDRLYWSQDYVTWHGTNLSREQQRLTRDGTDLIGFGDGFTRYAWNGQAWIEGPTVDLPGEMQDIAFGPQGAVALIDSTVYYSTNGIDFTEAERGPEPYAEEGICSETSPPLASDGIGPILVTEAGYVILGSADATWDRRAAHLCEPLAWSSADGSVWELRTTESPFGLRPAVWDVAAFGGRFVATGTSWDEPGNQVWVSDDGLDWRQVEVPELGSLLGVAGGEPGWFLTGHSSANYESSSLSVDMWFSADGETWDGPYPGPQGLFWAYHRNEPSVAVDAFVSVNGTNDGIVIGRLED